MRVVRFPRTRRGKVFEEIDNSLIKEITKGINEQYKKKHKKSKYNAVSRLDDSIFATPKFFVPSGILPVDCVVCYGRGFPVGIIEIYGAEATSKTALLENILAEGQVRGYHTAIFPMEFSLDYHRSKVVGIDGKKLIVVEEAETIEDVYEILRMTVDNIRKVEKERPIVIGIDTLASIPTRMEMEKDDLTKNEMAGLARQLSKMFRRLVKYLMMNKVCLICLNQTRTNLGITYGDKQESSGGKALRFYAWVRLKMRRVKIIKGPDDKIIGSMLNMEATKNKIAPPHKQCTYPLFYSFGIDKDFAVWEYAVDIGVFTQKGAHYKWHGKKVTRRKFPKFYRHNKKQIDSEIIEATRK